MLSYFNPLKWFRWFGEFVYSWLLSVPWREAPKAIPAVILMVVLLAAGIVALSDGAGWRNRLLNKQLEQANEMDDFETAELVLRRQLAGQPHDEAIAYRLANNLHQQGHEDQAIAGMRRLVQFKRYPPAAKWMIDKFYLQKRLGELAQEERDEFGEVLKLFTSREKDKKFIGYRALYADYLVATRKLTQAIPVLEELSEIQPQRGLQAAAISRSLGNFSSANQYAKKSLDAVKSMLNDDPSNTVLALAVAQNQNFLEQYESAFKTLAKTLENVTQPKDKEVLKQAIADTLVVWVEHIKKMSSETLAERIRIMKMLEYALKAAPNNPRVLAIVADQVLENLKEENPEIAKRRELLIAGAAPGIQHFIEGTAALLDNDVEDAVMHLTIASDLMPNSGIILNNLAVALTTRVDPDLDKALTVANHAIEMMPNPTPHFYETRGQILLRKKDYLKAIPDLTRALKMKSLAPKAHESLAECYEALGKPELAESHLMASKKTAALQKGQ